VLLAAQDVSFAYAPGRSVIRGVSAAFPAGAMTAILGPNGAGKSTLVRLLAGVRRPDSGAVLLNGRNLNDYTPEARARLVAFIPQFSGVAFPFAVREVVRMGLYAAARDGSSSTVDAALDLVGLAARADDTFESLSAGQQQRVTLARALAQLALVGEHAKPSGKVLLADEPVSAMDPANTLASLESLELLAQRGLCVVIVLHDLSLALRYCRRVVILNTEGTLAGAGDASEMLTEEIVSRLYRTPFRALQADGRIVALLPTKVAAENHLRE
jgi:iron complex transport system ATP-binding protein